MTKNKFLGLMFSAKNYRRMITHTFLAAATREKSTHFAHVAVPRVLFFNNI